MTARKEKTHGTWVEPKFDPDQLQYPPEGVHDDEARPARMPPVVPGVQGQPPVELGDVHRGHAHRPHANGLPGVANPAQLKHRNEDATRPD